MNCCDEYCSTYGCNQGRDCPVRVAKVGRKMADAEPLPPSIWRHQLKKLAKWMLLAILGWLIWVPLIYFALRA